MVLVAWDSVAPSKVSACFRKGGFKSDINIESVECDSNEVEFEQLSSVLATKIVNFDKFKMIIKKNLISL